MIKKYNIADLNMEFHLDGDNFFEKHLSAYENNYSEKNDVGIYVNVTDDIVRPDLVSLVKVGENVYYYRADESDNLIYYDSVSDRIIAQICYSPNYDKVKITLCDMKKMYNIDAKLFLFNIMHNCMSYLIQMHGGFVFHSSSVHHSGGGVAFSAESGTGKSTHTGLWLKEFKDAYIINDDSPIIRFTNGHSYIYGTPWAGTTGINKNIKLPLKAVVFLARGKENTICRIPFMMCMNDFFKGVRTPLTDEMMQKLISTADAVFSNVPVYRLNCNMDIEAAHVARNCIYK